MGVCEYRKLELGGVATKLDNGRLYGVWPGVPRSDSEGDPKFIILNFALVEPSNYDVGFECSSDCIFDVIGCH